VTIRYGSVCSGIEAASVAWHDLGWEPAWFSEIEAFPSTVLADHYPNVPNLGDMTQIADAILFDGVEAPDVLVGGTPCQAFSVAGLRNSLADERGNLSLVYCELTNAIDDVRARRGEEPCTIVWENVPGVLTTKDNAFGCFLAGLAGEDVPLEPSGAHWPDAGVVLGPERAIAWRVLDAQHFGLAQRRRRVFVVASARSNFDPAAVLFEYEGVRRDSAPNHNQEGDVTWWNGKAVSQTLDAVLYKGQMMPEKNRFPVIAVGERLCFPPTATKTEIARIAELTTPSVAVLDLLRKKNMTTASTTTESCGRVVLRRITPSEAERLMGFDGAHTAIPGAGDGARFKTIGNSMPVPVMRWIGERIELEPFLGPANN
jgi:DNA (cytosine-5)-methyltransferase 1